MPIDESARARAGEQEVNNAHQKDNDVRQTRNDAKANTDVEQAKTNANQGTTDTTQKDINSAQGDTNDTQADTNSDQLDTNIAQGITNSGQLDINTEVKDSIAAVKEGVSQTTSTSMLILETVRELSASMNANTGSLKAVSAALQENQEYTESIEAKSDSRASIFKKMWILLFVIGLVGSLGLFELNSYRTAQLCEARNDLNQNNVNIINLSIDRLMEQEQTADTVDSLSRLRDYVSKSAPVNCGDLIPFNGN